MYQAVRYRISISIYIFIQLYDALLNSYNIECVWRCTGVHMNSLLQRQEEKGAIKKGPVKPQTMENMCENNGNTSASCIDMRSVTL